MSYTNFLCSTLPENFNLTWPQLKDIKMKGNMVLLVLKRCVDITFMFVAAETAEGIEHT